MIKNTLLVISCLLATTFFSSIVSASHPPSTPNIANASPPPNCSQALPTSHPGFCVSFRTAAECYCAASGLPAPMCKDMNTLYARLISIFGSLQRACEYQHDTPTQTCIDDWNCYRSGGRDSTGQLCSGSGSAC